uniref:Uncharacterized protein n=1 Tax=Mycena chlorophos TaxID=658473 RepID=A0ABQ0MB17_MYCCL|nr:predicted protein [Mycena chlorophos]
MFSYLATTAKSTYAQITLNRVTIAFFLFSFLLSFVQGLLQIFTYSLDSQFSGIVTAIVASAEIPPKNITVLEGRSEHYTLFMCDDIPHGQTPFPCSPIFVSGQSYAEVNATQTAILSQEKSNSVAQDFSNGFTVTTYRDASGVANGVSLSSSSADPIMLSKQCTQTLVYPEQLLANDAREDVTFVFLQIWLFGVSLFAIAKNSVPHLLTALGTRLLIVAWSSYAALYRNYDRQSFFQQILADPGTPCGVQLFPQYFSMRIAYGLADIVLSITGFLFSCLFSWYLLKLYNAASFKTVGAPTHINHIYRWFSAVQACLQLEVFMLMASAGLWTDTLSGTAIKELSQHTTVYDGLIIATSLLVLPWIALGWYSVRKEHKGMMIGFLSIALFLIGGWSIMFYSIVYRWSFITWPYLACFTVVSFILIIASAILGAICWRHFGEGLAEYLHAESALADLGFAPEIFNNDNKDSDPDLEKGFYTYEEIDLPLPTFHAASRPPTPTKSSGLPVPAHSHSRSPSLSSSSQSLTPSTNVGSMTSLTPLRGPPPAYDRNTIQPF